MSTLDLLPVAMTIKVPWGGDASIIFTLTDGKNPIDISSDSVKLTIKDALNGTTLYTHINLIGQHSNPTVGKTKFTIARTLTDDAAATAVTTWRFEIRRILFGSGDEVPYIVGPLVVSPVI